MVIPSVWGRWTRWVQLAHDALKGAVITLTEHLDAMSDQESGAYTLTGLMVAL
jgi:hypothetical protein